VNKVRRLEQSTMMALIRLQAICTIAQLRNNQRLRGQALLVVHLLLLAARSRPLHTAA